MTVAIIIVVVVILLVLAAIGGYLYQGQRLRRRFGPEYDRMLESKGSRFRAEQELRGREKRHHSLTLHDLTPEARDRYAEEWRRIQAEFVDDPGTAATHADALITQIMTERGYPTAQFDQRAADLSVEHASTVDRYRRAHDRTVDHHQGTADTEDLRHALVDYRALVTDLLGTNPVPTTSHNDPATPDTTAGYDTATRDTTGYAPGNAGSADDTAARDDLAGTTAASEPVESGTTDRDRVEPGTADRDHVDPGETVVTGETGETGGTTEPVRNDRKTTHRRHQEAR